MYFTIRLYGRVGSTISGLYHTRQRRKSFDAFPGCGLITANDDISTKSRD